MLISLNFNSDKASSGRCLVIAASAVLLMDASAAPIVSTGLWQPTVTDSKQAPNSISAFFIMSDCALGCCWWRRTTRVTACLKTSMRRLIRRHPFMHKGSVRPVCVRHPQVSPSGRKAKRAIRLRNDIHRRPRLLRPDGCPETSSQGHERRDHP